MTVAARTVRLSVTVIVQLGWLSQSTVEVGCVADTERV